MARSLKKSNARWLSSDSNELCDRLKLLLQEKQAGNNSDIVIEDIIAIADKLKEYKCKSKRRHNFLVLSCIN